MNLEVNPTPQKIQILGIIIVLMAIFLQQLIYPSVIAIGIIMIVESNYISQKLEVKKDAEA
jgi:hypothetical protein